MEIWLGDGKRSLGARQKRGRVQVFDSYTFVSRSYGGMEYHFKSIETWLKGICTRQVHLCRAEWRCVPSGHGVGKSLDPTSTFNMGPAFKWELP